jgi:hypothetical protein
MAPLTNASQLQRRKPHSTVHSGFWPHRSGLNLPARYPCRQANRTTTNAAGSSEDDFDGIAPMGIASSTELLNGFGGDKSGTGRQQRKLAIMGGRFDLKANMLESLAQRGHIK